MTVILYSLRLKCAILTVTLSKQIIILQLLNNKTELDFAICILNKRKMHFGVYSATQV